MSTEEEKAFIAQPLTPTSMVLDLGCTSAICNASLLPGGWTGDLSLDKMPNPTLHRSGLAEKGPLPI